jgi:hypothetical protein
MEKIIAFCGIVCSECPAFIATKNDDDNKRRETAKLWSERYKAEIKPEDINCTGCLSEEKVIGHCKVCEIRKCGRGKKVKNCAYCNEYVCEKLDNFFKMAPEIKTALDKIKKGLRK